MAKLAKPKAPDRVKMTLNDASETKIVGGATTPRTNETEGTKGAAEAAEEGQQ